jgi:hypothetical protein
LASSTGALGAADDGVGAVAFASPRHQEDRHLNATRINRRNTLSLTPASDAVALALAAEGEQTR